MYHAWTNGGHTKGELEVEGTNGNYSIPSVFEYILPKFAILSACFLTFKSSAENAAELKRRPEGLKPLCTNKQLMAVGVAIMNRTLASPHAA